MKEQEATQRRLEEELKRLREESARGRKEVERASGLEEARAGADKRAAAAAEQLAAAKTYIGQLEGKVNQLQVRVRGRGCLVSLCTCNLASRRADAVFQPTLLLSCVSLQYALSGDTKRYMPVSFACAVAAYLLVSAGSWVAH